MFLHEEYIRRHKLSVPVVRADARSTVFLRSFTVPHRWEIVTIHWVPCETHPGHYNVRVFRPNHNGYRTHMLICTLEESVYWENYEPFILSLVQNRKRDYHGVSSDERVLAAWEMFLLIFDAKLAMIGPDFIDFAARSIAPKASLEDKVTAITAAKAHLRLFFPDVYDHLHHQILPLADFYSDWLVRLVND